MNNLTLFVARPIAFPLSLLRLSRANFKFITHARTWGKYFSALHAPQKLLNTNAIIQGNGLKCSTIEDCPWIIDFGYRGNMLILENFQGSISTPLTVQSASIAWSLGLITCFCGSSSSNFLLAMLHSSCSMAHWPGELSQ